MAKRPLTEKEIQLNKRYIPINIITCVICLVAIFTLMFAPILKIDIGKVLSDEKTIKLVDEKVEDALKDGMSDGPKVDYAPVVSRIIHNVLGNAKGALSFTAAGALKVANAPADKKVDAVSEEMLFGKNGLINNMIDSIIDGVLNMFTDEANRTLLEETLVSTLVTSLVEGTDLEGVLTDQKVKDLTEAFKGFEQVEDGNVAPMVDNICAELSDLVGEVSPEDKESITAEVQKMYDKTAAALPEGEEVTFEAVVAVAVSSNVDLSQFDLGSLIGGLLGDDDKKDNDKDYDYGRIAAAKYDDGSDDNIVTSYDGILEKMGLGGEEKAALKTKLKNSLNGTLNDTLKEYNEYFGYYGYVFYVMLVFMLLWAIQFIFAFAHIFTKRKRFKMWYTKLLCWIPAIIWLALKLAPTILNKIDPSILSGDSGSFIALAFGGISSATWVSGLCYILLWATSIVNHFVFRKPIERELEAALAAGDTGASTKEPVAESEAAASQAPAAETGDTAAEAAAADNGGAAEAPAPENGGSESADSL